MLICVRDRNGNVTMFLQGSTGNTGNFTVTPSSDSLASRSWWDDIVDEVLDGQFFAAQVVT